MAKAASAVLLMWGRLPTSEINLQCELQLARSVEQIRAAGQMAELRVLQQCDCAKTALALANDRTAMTDRKPPRKSITLFSFKGPTYVADNLSFASGGRKGVV
jgi:hypothetical protein